MTTTPEQRLEAAQRELDLRHRVYNRQVANGRMTEAKMHYEIACMADIVEVLSGLAEDRQGSLFAGST